MHYFYIILIFLTFGCAKSSEKPSVTEPEDGFSKKNIYSKNEGSRKKNAERLRKLNVHGEFIYRKHHEFLFNPAPPSLLQRQKYPWEHRFLGSLPKITKEFFRCQGRSTNSIVSRSYEGKEPLIFKDCAGGECHGLPLRDGKEFIYSCLIDLLNYVQEKTQKKVVITTGHRCPQHNNYAEYTKSSGASKHMMGAEVDFYVEGLEEQPQVVIDLLQRYYKETVPFKGQKEFENFLRYDKEKLNVAITPWYNKEIFIKLYQKEEGRDFDNQHPYPYIGVQVRFDRDKLEVVKYDPKQAQNYLRY